MKKKIVLSAIPGIITFLGATPIAWAAAVCPTGKDFSGLCKLNPGDQTLIFQNAFNILLVAAIGLSIGFLLYGGIKWIISGGDKGKLDAARGTITAAIVGLMIAFLAFFIVGLVNYVFGIDPNSKTIFSLPQLNATPIP